MENQGQQVYQSSVLHSHYEPVRDGQFQMPTWGIIIVLIIVFIVLKSFIYIKDDQRHGK